MNCAPVAAVKNINAAAELNKAGAANPECIVGVESMLLEDLRGSIETLAQRLDEMRASL